jgi:hypothetical protein
VPASAAPPDPAAILAGLRKALAKPLPLQGEGAEALFPKGATGKRLVQAAIEQGLLTKHSVVTRDGRRSRKSEHGELTEKGRQQVLDADNPKAILESLLPAIKSLAVSPPPQQGSDSLRRELAEAIPAGARAIEEAFRREVEKATSTCTKAVESAFTTLQNSVESATKKVEAATAKLGQTVLGALPTVPADAAVDLRPALTALQAALARVAAPPASPVPSPAAVAPAALEEAIVAFVNDRAAATTVGCQFDVLWDHLKQRHAHLTIGAFQDALRKLHEAGRIRFGGWARIIDDLPQPQLALFVSAKVMYYAQPAYPNR